MVLLKPSLPPHHVPAGDGYCGSSTPSIFPYGFHQTATSHLADIVEEGDEKIHVAVGKSLDKAMVLLQWSFSRFKNREICLFHVYQPSSTIPTLLGKLPVSQANTEVVTAYRKEERQQIMKLLETYMSICCAAKVKASIITIEADQVQKGIVDVVNRHGIKKLVMGAVPENCTKVKKNSRKANYAAKNASSSCEIWFVYKGKHVWTREASEGPCSVPLYTQSRIVAPESLRSRSFQHGNNKSIHSECLRSNSARSTICSGISSLVQGGRLDTEPSSLSTIFLSTSSYPIHKCADTKVHFGTNPNIEEERLKSQLIEAQLEAEAANNEVFAERSKRKGLEEEAIDAISKVNVYESAHVQEIKLREEAEEAMRTTLQDKGKLLDEKEEVTRELQRTIRNVAFLDSRLQEASLRQGEAAVELSLIQASVATMWQEKQQIRRQKMEALRWLERWRNRGQVGAARCNAFTGFVEELPELAEFSLSDLQNATCDFSESFKIGQGGYGCVYKGEMLGRTVAIRKLQTHNMHGPSEFHQEVQVLGSLQHPHLVTLLGVCPEAWSLVYEYLPNGSLQDHLFRKSNTAPLTWNNRAQIVVEISSALCFLHSSKPETIVHGDLKPENILLDSALSCKICDFGICRLINEESLYCPSFRWSTEPKGAFTYTDPEFQRTGILTPKSDIYSFGIIILQLLTGRPPVGLAGATHKAVLCEKLSSVVDSSAGEWPPSILTRLVELGLQCCELNGRDRPELTPSLVRELKQLLHVSEERPMPSFFLCPIRQEIMHDPQVAADGFTYEGEAIRQWLESGHETSPMTNLRLTHLHLTPNHVLRHAIQDWLCKS
ncbi:Protein kinase domain [Quillaja saponaria]|uniref:RING-type E3 ubiquitin transferase n=1 Tax=Quillaja saponaria TaxID=32244 RepID=A0AAD7PAH6_QUISA|nr:Protein kinase domain [Quillaja saponaria]